MVRFFLRKFHANEGMERPMKSEHGIGFRKRRTAGRIRKGR